MLEYPEAVVIQHQLKDVIIGKHISSIVVNQHPHAFAWLDQGGKHYPSLLVNLTIQSVHAYGGFVEIRGDDTVLIVGDGVNIRYYPCGIIPRDKHQLLLQFSDGSSLVFSIQMYGGIYAFKFGECKNPYIDIARNAPSFLSDKFTFEYFKSIFHSVSSKMSIKAFLATQQRFPGLGNGILQEILYWAKFSHKRLLETLDEEDQKRLYLAIVSTIKDIIQNNGRDTEKDIYNQKGGYATKLSKLTCGQTCSRCHSPIKKAAYLGGSIYFCDCLK